MEDLTVIPMTNDALQAVKTPFMAFKQPFPERAGRFERQLEAFRMSMAVVHLTDTWPDATYDTITFGRTNKALSDVGQPVDGTAWIVWPETAIYKTEVAQLYKIDERIRYRPQAYFFGQLREHITGHWTSECGMSAEAAIVVPDRGIYEHGESAQPIELGEESKRVTGILVIDHLTDVHSEALQSWQMQTEQSKELIVVLCGVDQKAALSAVRAADIVVDASPMDAPSDAVNLALQQAHGAYITILDSRGVSLRERLERQCSIASDVSYIAPKRAQELALHTHSWRAGVPSHVEFSLMFHRRVFERTGGMYPTLPVGFIYDKFLQAQQHFDLTFSVLRQQLLGSIDYRFPYGRVYSQQVYNDVCRRRSVNDGEYHAWSLRSRR